MVSKVFASRYSLLSFIKYKNQYKFIHAFDGIILSPLFKMSDDGKTQGQARDPAKISERDTGSRKKSNSG